jgi:alkaline phosphatase D
MRLRRFRDDNPRTPQPRNLPLDQPGRFRVAFSSRVRTHEDPVQPIWDPVATAKPDLFLWLGDNVYADTIYPEFLASCGTKRSSGCSFGKSS